MTGLWRQLRAAIRLEVGELRRSRWLPFVTAVYAVLAGALLFAGMRESAVLGFTGMGRVLLSFTHALLLVLPLLALAGTTQVVPRARDDGTVELLFSHPLDRGAYLLSITLARYAVLGLPLAVLLLAMALAADGFGERIPWAMLARTVAVSAALLWAFVGAGMAVSVGTRDQAKAVVYGLLLWSVGVALLDFVLVGVLLQWQLPPRAVFVLASVNPVQAARLALLSGVEPDLTTLGPVGFYVVHHVGRDAVLALGLLWPWGVGCAAWIWALQRFRAGDVV